MKKLGILSLFSLIFAFGMAANAQTVGMDGINPGSGDGRPTRGMTQSSVQSKFGSPVNTRAAIGDPPITRWEYQDFVVFFEYDKVIHAVSKR